MLVEAAKPLRRLVALIAIAGAIGLGLSGRAAAGPHEDANAAGRRGDYQAEYRILAPEAARGQAWAQNNLGNMYLYGRGLMVNDAEALAWFQKAAAQRDPGGEINLGQMYEIGSGVAEDPARAASLYQAAGEQGRAGGWAMLKRLCDHQRSVAPGECARVPPGTVSAPDIQLSGRPGVWFKLFLDLLAVALSCAVLVRKVRALLRKRNEPAGPLAAGALTAGALAAAAGGDDVAAPQANARASLRFQIFGCVAATVLVLAPLAAVIFRNPQASPWSTPMVLWIVSVLLAWTAIVAVRARRLRGNS